jgi:hypothetical protein
MGESATEASAEFYPKPVPVVQDNEGRTDLRTQPGVSMKRYLRSS